MPTSARRTIAAALCLVCLGCIGGCATGSQLRPRPHSPTVTPARDALVAMNDQVRSDYRAARARALARVPAIILVDFDRMVLVHDHRREIAWQIPREYHPLKSVDHLALGLHAVLSPPGSALDGPRRAGLMRLRVQAQRARMAVARLGLPADRLARQRALIDRVTDFVAHTLASGAAPDPSTLTALERGLVPGLMANAHDAVRAQLEQTHRAVTAWRTQLGEAVWSGLHVVILGAHMPREGHAATQYFLRLLGEPAEGGRVVYAEGVHDDALALDLLATHLLDAEIAAGFFGDSRRMHRDVLADEARAILDQIFAPSPSPSP